MGSNSTIQLLCILPVLSLWKIQKAAEIRLSLWSKYVFSSLHVPEFNPILGLTKPPCSLSPDGY